MRKVSRPRTRDRDRNRSRPRPRRDPRRSRPRPKPRLKKTGLETQTKSRDSITAFNASERWLQSNEYCAHIRGKIIKISTEIGHLYGQHYILLDSNLRSDLEKLLLQCWTFDVSAGSQRSMLVKHDFNQTNIALISVEKLLIFKLKQVI